MTAGQAGTRLKKHSASKQGQYRGGGMVWSLPFFVRSLCLVSKAWGIHCAEVFGLLSSVQLQRLNVALVDAAGDSVGCGVGGGVGGEGLELTLAPLV